MKLWIILKEGIGFSRIIADTIQDFLNDYINLSIGNVKKIDPAFLVEEKLNHLIIGDDLEGKQIPSPELQNWLIEFLELCKKNQLIIKSISYYCVTSKEYDVRSLWINFLRRNDLSLTTFPPVLQLKLEEGGLTLEKNVLESVKNYSNEFIETFFNKKIGGI